MAQITPMGRLKDNFKNFSKIIEGYSFFKGMLELAGREESTKYSYYSYKSHTKKAICSDFIRIFKLNNEESFAFSFNNINGDLDKVIILVTYKNKDEEIFTNGFSFEEFKLLFKSFISSLNSLSFESVQEFLKHYNSFFAILDNNYSDKEALMEKEVIDNIEKQVKVQEKKYKKAQKVYNEHTTELHTIKNNIAEEAESLREELGIRELEALLKEKRAIVTKKVNELEKEKKLSDMENKNTYLRREASGAEIPLTSILNKELKKVSLKHLKEGIENHFKDRFSF